MHQYFEDLLLRTNQQRAEVARFLSLLKLATREYPSDHYDFAAHYVNLAFMWIGKVKAAIGVANPYPESMNPESKQIEKAVDTVDATEEFQTLSGDEIAFVKLLRKQMEETCSRMARDIRFDAENSQLSIAQQQAYTNLENTKMALGLVLGQIRDRGETGKEEPTPIA